MTTNNAINISAAGLVKYDGAGTFSGVTVTQYDVLVGAASNGITSVAPSATSGVALISQGSSSNPTFGTVVVAGGGTGATTLTGVLVGNGTSAVTATAITQYNVITGGASNAPNSVAPGSTSGVPLISQGASSQPIFGTALIAGGGTAATSFNTYGVVVTGSTSTTALSSLSLSSGQLVIGGSTTPAAATLTAGTGISISNGNNSITINATGSGLSWVVVSGTSQAMAVNTGYTSNNGSLCTLTLPSTASVGDTIVVTGLGAGGWAIAQNSSQLIHFGSAVTTTGTGGSLASTNANDSITITCVVANTTWTTRSSIGNITVV